MASQSLKELERVHASWLAHALLYKVTATLPTQGSSNFWRMDEHKAEAPITLQGTSSEVAFTELTRVIERARENEHDPDIKDEVADVHMRFFDRNRLLARQYTTRVRACPPGPC